MGRATRNDVSKTVQACCTHLQKLFECRKRLDAINLTESEEDINRVALALFNGALPVLNKELEYNIVSTLRFNVGKTFEYQDQYNFLVKHTTLLDAGISPGSPSHQNSTIALQPTSWSRTRYDAQAGDAQSYPSSTELPLCTKAAKWMKLCLEISAQSEVVSSVRNLTECMQASD
jgi:hypothetical protein